MKFAPFTVQNPGTPPENIKPPTDVGTGMVEESAEYLSKIIDVLNDRFGTNFTEADQLFFDQVKEQAKADAEVVQRAGDVRVPSCTCG